MRRLHRHTLRGWALGLAGFAAIASAIPAIAAKSDQQRDAAKWAAIAADFAAFEAPDAGFAAEFLSADTTAERDLEQINTLFTRDIPLRRVSDDVMAEAQCLAEAVYYEARSETKPGQIAVAQVIQNRVASKHYPNTICGVVYQGAHRPFACQFSFACDGSMEREPGGLAWIRAKRVAALSMTGQASDMTGRATHYHTTAVNPDWASTLKYTKQIGSHKFYRFRWRERPVVGASVAVAPPT